MPLLIGRGSVERVDALDDIIFFPDCHRPDRTVFWEVTTHHHHRHRFSPRAVEEFSALSQVVDGPVNLVELGGKRRGLVSLGNRTRS